MVGFGTRGDCGGTRGARRANRGHGDLDEHGDSSRHCDLGEDNSVISCFYCKEPRHIKKFCPKLIGKNTHSQSFQFAYVTINNQASKTRDNCNISMSKSEYAEYLQFQAFR